MTAHKVSAHGFNAIGRSAAARKVKTLRDTVDVMAEPFADEGARAVEDPDGNRAGVQINAAIESMLLRTELDHGLLRMGGVRTR